VLGKNIQITLYEIFGYFLPGTIVLAGMGLLFWTLYFPKSVVPIEYPDAELWAPGAVIAYFLGHLAHAFGRILGRPEFDVLEERNWARHMPPTVLANAKKRVASVLHLEPDVVTSRLLFSFCDESLVQTGEIGDPEIY